MSSGKPSKVISYVAVFGAGTAAAASYILLFGPSTSGAQEKVSQEVQILRSDADAQKLVLPSKALEESEVGAARKVTKEQLTEQSPLRAASGHGAQQIVQDQSVTNTNPLTPIADLERGTIATIEGVVQRISDEDEFLIADTSGSIKVWTGTTFFPVEQGERVSVRGFVDDGILRELYAQQIVRENGSVVQISSDY